ncbi:sulfatase-like hydrolase/transferase [Planctomicrobium sp. SH668]|uniref:sulfatase-like hydrolase/transferase n=1 Tax=Planctomicrobium sp. SH668 TaxID=3448126 RepID=UPI003F5C40DE
MIRLKKLTFLAATIVAGLATSLSLAADRPNVLFIFADDQTFASLHAGGNEEIQTPNLDRLYNSGTVFTHAYNMGGYHGAVCVASRTMLNTGRSLWHAKEADEKLGKKEYDSPLWAQRLESTGYRTYLTGKWHVATDASKIFQTTRHIRGGMPAPLNKTLYQRPVQGEPDAWSPSDPEQLGFWTGGKHWSEVTADDAIDFIDSSKDHQEPFFMYVGFNAPHDPRQSPQEFVDRYPHEKIRIPKSFVPEHPNKDEIGCPADLRDENLAPFPRTEYSVQVHRQEYYAIITHLDEQVGRVLDALEASGKRENTYIFFTADHGLACGNHGLMGKQNLYDHSVRVPFIAVGPRFEAGKKIDAPIYLQDVHPTTLELAGVEKPDDVFFKSLLPLAEGKVEQNYDSILGSYRTHQRSVTHAGWKLIVFPNVPRILLFDLKNDPEELKNLAEDEQQTERIADLWDRLIELQKEVDDPLTLNRNELLAADAK